MGKLTAKELQRRYRAGERNFAGVDLSGESLRGMNLKGIDLSGADLSRTDIRGTNFSKADLIGTQFVAVITGTQVQWLLIQLIVASVVVVAISFCAGILWSSVAVNGFAIAGRLDNSMYTIATFLSIVLGIALTFRWKKFYFRYTSMAPWVALITFLTISSLYGFIFFVNNGSDSLWLFAQGFAIGFARLFTAAALIGIFFIGINYLISRPVALSIAFARDFAGVLVALFIIFVAIIAATSGSLYGAYNNLSSIAGTESYAACAGIVGFLISVLHNFEGASDAIKRELINDSIGDLGAWISSWGGTSFENSNLTGASFSRAMLKGVNFHRSDLTKTSFHLSQKTNFSFFGKSRLSDYRVRNLLVTLRGNSQSYVGLNLKDINLFGADLANTDLSDANLIDATLEKANLQGANLTRIQALGTNFQQAVLTGATIEAWHIDSTTNLDGAICDYVYLLRNHQERRPSSGTFAPGDFTKLFQEVLDTIDLIFQNGVDWKAFVRTFNDVQGQYDDAALGVQAIENKGDGVVVVKLHAAPDADKPAIHQSFTEIYQLALQEAEARYKAQLDAKDDQIADYRQQSANMQEVIKLLAQRPINVDVKATAESKAMQGNDHSRTVTIGGNATNSIIQAGDGNTAELQQVTLPPPDRVNIQAELAALKEILAGFQRPVIDAVMMEVEEEIAKPTPDKSVVATTLETGLTYARNLQGFAEAIDQLRPHVQNAAGWLGEHGTKLLPLVGLVL